MESDFIPNILEDFWGKDGSSCIMDKRWNDVKQILKIAIETKNCDALKKLTPIQFYCFDLMVENTCGKEHKDYLQACQDMFSSSNLKELQMTTRALLAQHGYAEESSAELDQLLEATEGNPENWDQISFVRWTVLNARGQIERKSELFESYEITLQNTIQELEKVKTEIESWMTLLIEDHVTMWHLMEQSFRHKYFRDWKPFICKIEKRYGSHVLVGKVYKNYAVALVNIRGQSENCLRAYETAYENAKNQDSRLTADILRLWAMSLLHELDVEEAQNKLEQAQKISDEKHLELDAKISFVKAKVLYARYIIEAKKCYDLTKKNGVVPEYKLLRLFGEEIFQHVEKDRPIKDLIKTHFKKIHCKFRNDCRNNACCYLH